MAASRDDSGRHVRNSGYLPDHYQPSRRPGFEHHRFNRQAIPGHNAGTVNASDKRAIAVRQQASAEGSRDAAAVEPGSEPGEDAAMNPIPRPRDPLAPESRSARSGVIWAAAKPDVSATLVARISCRTVAARTGPGDGPRLPRPRTRTP